jgi:hypothetical protein
VRSRYSTVSISSKTNLKDDAAKLSKSAAMAVGLAEKDLSSYWSIARSGAALDGLKLSFPMLYKFLPRLSLA